MTHLKSHWQLLALTLVIFALWQTPVVTPLKILVVFLHELSHALAAWATGGSVVQMSVSAQQGGFAITRGGNLFMILSAGYLGSLLLGVCLLWVALRSDADRIVTAALGVVMALITVLYLRDLFAVVFGCLGAIVLLAMARFLGQHANDLALRVIGLSSMFYVPYDIYDDTIARRGVQSDAQMLADAFGGTAMIWGGVWLTASCAVIVWSVRRILGTASNIPLRP